MGRQLCSKCGDDKWRGAGPTPLVGAPCRQRLADRPAASTVRRGKVCAGAPRPFRSKSSHVGDLGLRARACGALANQGLDELDCGASGFNAR